MATSTTADGAVPTKGSGGKPKKLIVMIIALFVLLAAGGGGAWYFLKVKDGAKGKNVEKEKHKAPPVFVDFDQFTVNLVDEGGDRYLQTEFVLEVSGDDLVEPIKQQMPILKSSILLLLSSKAATEISTKAGKRKLAEQIIQEIRQRVHSDKPNKGIEKVHFATFVIQ
jgi:flagellar protein FliL